MNGIDKYMIPLDSIRSTVVGGIMAMILLALFMGLGAALIVVGIVSNLLDRSEAANGSYVALGAGVGFAIVRMTRSPARPDK